MEPSGIAAGQNRGDSALPDDAALAAGCLAGDMSAYERLYQLQGARMRNLARNLLGSPADAEDAVQDTFLKIQRGIESFRGQSSFVTWTFRILVNTCYDVRRSRVRRKEQAQDDRKRIAAAAGASRSGRAPVVAHGARTSAGGSDAPPARCVSVV